MLIFWKICIINSFLAIFLRKFLKIFENFPASGGPPEEPPRGWPPKGFPPKQNPGNAHGLGLGRSQDFFRGNTFWKFFKKILKKFLTKIAKMDYVRIFFKRFYKSCVNFSRVWTKNTIYWKFWEKFEIFWWNFYR